MKFGIFLKNSRVSGIYSCSKSKWKYNFSYWFLGVFLSIFFCGLFLLKRNKSCWAFHYFLNDYWVLIQWILENFNCFFREIFIFRWFDSLRTSSLGNRRRSLKIRTRNSWSRRFKRLRGTFWRDPRMTKSGVIVSKIPSISKSNYETHSIFFSTRYFS